MSEEQMYEPPMYDVGVEIRNMKAELVKLRAALREKEIEVDRLHYHYTNGKKGNPHWLPGEGMPP